MKTATSDLSPAARKWLSAMRKEYEFEPHTEKMLLSAAQLLDRIQQAREAVAREGSYFTDKHGVIRAHPGIKIERDSHALFAVLVGRMKLPVDEAPVPKKRGR